MFSFRARHPVDAVVQGPRLTKAFGQNAAGLDPLCHDVIPPVVWARRWDNSRLNASEERLSVCEDNSKVRCGAWFM